MTKLRNFSIPAEALEILLTMTPANQKSAAAFIFKYIFSDDSEALLRSFCFTEKDKLRTLLALLDPRLGRARKAQERRDDRKAHPEKYPPRRRKAPAAIKLDEGNVVKVDPATSVATPFDHYIISGNTITYFRKVGEGTVSADGVASFRPTQEKPAETGVSAG